MASTELIESAELNELINFTHQLADLARQTTQTFFRQSVAVEYKADESPVTQADRGIERVLRTQIEQHYPAHGVFGEEYGRSSAQPYEYLWVLDPIDGTKSFISGMPTFGSLIALLHHGKPVIGAIEAPALAERWLGAQGQPTRHNDTVCKARDCQELALATLYCTSIDMFSGEPLRRFNKLSDKVRMRRFGGDCYAYGLLALGFVDLVVEGSMEPYDYLALVTVVEGAGGVISDWQGKPLGLDSDGSVVAAATAELHALAIAELAS